MTHRLLPHYALRLERCLRLSRPPLLRPFSTTPAICSGHNRWSKIRHDKGKNDQRRGLNFSRISGEVTTAVRMGGAGPENLRLAAALAAARKAGMTKDRISSAIARGQGLSASGTALESMLIECMGPGGVAILVEANTDNTRRTLQDLRGIIKQEGAREGKTMFMFDKIGLVRVAGRDMEEVMDVALEIEGFEDVLEIDAEDGKLLEVTTDVSKVTAVVDALKEALDGVEIKSAGIEWVPNENTIVTVGDEEAEALESFVEKLQECGDVVEVYTNAVSAWEAEGKKEEGV